MQSETEQKALFESVPVSKAVLTLAVPTVIGQLITVVYNMADTFFVGQTGDPAQVAAATLAMPVFMLLTAFANLFGIGGSSVISRLLGADRCEDAKHCASFCVWSGVILSIAYGIIVWMIRGPLFDLLGATDETWEFLNSYLFWTVVIGSCPTVMNAEFANLIRSEGYSRDASIGVALGGILNIFLDHLFIFTFHMDITGAAIATMLSNTCAVAYFLLFLWRIRKATVITPDPRSFRMEKQIAGNVLAAGVPSAIMTLMGTVSNTALNHLIAGYSTEAVAGMGIAKKFDLIAYQIAQGMTQGTLPLIAYNFASGNRKRMNSAVKTMLADSLVLALAAMVLLLLFSTGVTRLFINDETTVSYGAKFLRVICIACPTTALNFGIITVFQAVGAGIQPVILSFLRKGTLDVPLMILFDQIRGIDWIPWATPIADQLALVIALILFVPYLRKISKQTV
jgi:multidrug efflux pump